MTRIAAILLTPALAASLLAQTAVQTAAQTQVTVQQLQDYLLSARARKESDAALARQLSSVQLVEQLTGSRLAALLSRLRAGPQTAEQVGLLAASSVFEAPPPADLPTQPPPNPLEQKRILQAARDYAASSVLRLPDLLATRATRSYDNALQLTGGKKHPQPEIVMHFVGGFERQVTVRGGQEVPFSPTPGANLSHPARVEGMSTWGEFGPLLATVLSDAQAGSIAWSRWQYGDDRARLAVFRYSVPRSASHDLVDLYSSIQLLNDPGPSRPLQFRDLPAYHGDLYIEPASGTVMRITLNAELVPPAPVLLSQLSVDFAPVEIAGKPYTCPVRGIAVSVVHNAEMESIDGAGPERFVNMVRFTDYHKFASTSRIVADN